MDTIKKVFGSGKNKDDEYNEDSSATQRDNSAYDDTASTGGRPTGTAEEYEPKHGVLRQILNPGSEKYDAAQYQGSDDVLAKPVGEGERIPGALATGNAARPIQSGESAHREGGVLRQILNPGGDKYDGQGYETTGQVGSGSSTNAPTYGSTAPTQESHARHDAAAFGGAGAGAGALAYETGRDHHAYGQTSGERSYASNSSTGATTATPQTSNTQNYSRGTSGITSQTTGEGRFAANEQQMDDSYHNSSAARENVAATSTSTRGNDYSSTGSTSRHRYGGDAAAMGSGGLAAGGLASREHNQPSTTQTSGSQRESNLSHHVYNGVTEQVPHRSGHQDYAAPRSSTNTTAAYEPTPFHATPAAYSGQSSSSHGIYNSITGRHGEHEHDHEHATHSHHSHHSHGHSNTATATSLGAATGITGASLADRSRTDQNTGTSTSNTRASGPDYSTTSTDASHRSTYDTGSGSRQVPGAFPGEERAGFGTAGATGGTAGAALAAQDAIRRHETQQGAGTYGSQPSYNTSAYTSAPSTQRDTTGGSYGSDNQTTSGQSQHHYGRDAALAGGAGALGAGAYESERHHDSTGSSSRAEHNTSSTTGPHKSALLNKLDPRVQSNTEQGSSNDSRTGRDTVVGAATGAGMTEGGKPLSGQTSSNSNTGLPGTSQAASSSTTDSRTGRDTVFGATTGAGMTEGGKPLSGSTSNSANTGASNTSSQTTSSNNIAPHNSSLLNKLDPRVQNDQSTTESRHGHVGRDAAIGTAAGAGVYEAGRHHGANTSDARYDSSGTTAQHASSSGYGNTSADTTSSTGYGNTSADTTSSAGYGNTRTAPTSSTGYGSTSTGPTTSTTTSTTTQTTTSHGPGYGSSNTAERSHGGRDAALVGGAGVAAGAGGYEAERHHHDHHQSSTGTNQPSGSQSSNTGVHHRSALLNKLDPRVHDSTPSSTHHSQQDQQDRHAQSSHTGRDAVVVGGVGAGAYEADRHHGHHQSSTGVSQPSDTRTSTSGVHHSSTGTSQPSSTHASSTGVHHNSALLNRLDPRVHDESTHTGAQHAQHTEHRHGGRDAALAGGAGAGIGAGAYEGERHHGISSSSRDGYDAGQTSGTYAGYGSNSATGPHSSNTANQFDPRLRSEGVTSGTQQPGQHSHTGGNLAAGSVVGTAIYEAERHHGAVGASTGNYDQSSSDNYNRSPADNYSQSSSTGYGQQHGQHSHTGRDAALSGGAGGIVGAGIGRHENERSQGATGPSSGSYDQSTGYSQPSTAQQYGQHSRADRDHGVAGAGGYAAERNQGAVGASSGNYDQSTGYSQSSTGQQYGQHSHTGRDLAAGSVVGTGIYEAEKHHGASSSNVNQSSNAGYSQSSSGPASKTVGPHDSNIANILDPRVKPQPQYQKEHTTTGPYQSDTLNRLDPRVQHDPAQAQTTGRSHEGRDMGIGAGAGAGAGAGYAAHETREHERQHHHLGQHDPARTQTTGHSHEGRDVAVGAGTGAGVGYAANETREHERQHHHLGQHDPARTQTTGHSHEGRDIAAGTAAGSGAGYATHETHEHDRQHHHHGPQVREDEHHHNKLHKEPKEKKEGFLHKLLHPHKKENELDSPTHEHDSRHGHHDNTAATSSTATGHETYAQSIDPHTGLPVNTRYGTGQGGTDGNANIAGYQEGSSARGTDWQNVGKQNTPY